MKKLMEYLGKMRLTVNILQGASAGFSIWVLHIIAYRLFGLEAEYFGEIGKFMLSGMILGGVVGMVSLEILWHKKNRCN